MLLRGFSSGFVQQTAAGWEVERTVPVLALRQSPGTEEVWPSWRASPSVEGCLAGSQSWETPGGTAEKGATPWFSSQPRVCWLCGPLAVL